MANEDFAVRVVWAVKDSLDQAIRELRQMKTPEDAFQEKQRAIHASADQAFQGLFSAQRGSAIAENFRKAVFRHGHELHQLSQDHEATLDAQTKDFDNKRCLTIEMLYRSLIQAVGVEFVQKIIRDMTKKPSDAAKHTSAPASQPTPSPTEAEPEVVSPIEHPVRSPPTCPERPVPADASSSSARKRRTDAEPESRRPRKRNVPTSKRIPAMRFDDIYQKGHAETKHIIVEYPKGAGQWWIIRCLDCPRDFKDRPVVIAGAHISSEVHGQQPRDAANVIEHFGIAVVGCNEALAEKNNAIARQAFRREGKGPRPAVDTAFNDGKHGRRGTAGIVDPTPGQIYLAYWGKAKKSWPVLLLPTANLEDVGVPKTLEDLELLDELPPCYRYNATTKTLEWNEGFENGGERVAQRQFPVMWFDDDLKFPSQSQVSWLPARNLEVFDMESAVVSEVPHIRTVRAYLKARPQIPSRQDESGEMDVDDDSISQLGNETRHTPEVDKSNEPEATIAEPRGEGVKAGHVPVLNDGETSIGADGKTDDNLRRKSIDIISISSAPMSEWSEIHPDEAAVPSPSELNRTTSAPHAAVETTTSTNTGANNPERPNPINTAFGSTVERPHLVNQTSAEPPQVPEPRVDYLTTIAQNSLKQNLGPSNSIPPETVQQLTPREDSPLKISPMFSNFSRTSSFSNTASHTTTIPLRAEMDRTPFTHPNQPHQYHGPNSPQVANRSNHSAMPPSQSEPQPRQYHGPNSPQVANRSNHSAMPPSQSEPQPRQYHGPNSPQVENRPNNSAMPSGQSQPQPHLQNTYVPIQPNPRSDIVQGQPAVPVSDPRQMGQQASWSRQGNQGPGTAAHANHPGAPHSPPSPYPRPPQPQPPSPYHTAPHHTPPLPAAITAEHNRVGGVGNGASRSPATYQEFFHNRPPEKSWRPVNGPR